MQVPPEYLDLDLYEVLRTSKEADQSAVRKAYLRRALTTHPDKPTGDNAEFQQVAFAYSVLSDPQRRKRYDTTGSLAEVEDDVGIADLFQRYMRPDITEEMIAEHRSEYQGSDEERNDLFASYRKYNGDFDLVFESVMHASIEDQDRLISLLKEGIESGKIESTSQFRKTTTSVKNKKRANAANKEAAEAEETRKELGLDKVNDEAGLAALIKSRQHNRFDDLISKIENKYTSSEKSSKGKKAQKPERSGKVTKHKTNKSSSKS